MVLLLVAVLAGACDSGPAAAPAPTNSGMPEIVLSTEPSPANSVTETELVIDVQNSQGLPLTGATVTVLADMVTHSMGLMQGLATEQGNGRYATLVPFVMGGDWKVTIEVRDSQKNLLRRQDFTLAVE